MQLMAWYLIMQVKFSLSITLWMDFQSPFQPDSEVLQHLCKVDKYIYLVYDEWTGAQRNEMICAQ